ncbi:MAG TPA: hypothetical protein PLP42_13405 [Acidobacteriota bacterium]|nr:hypothetical protein [Acidobacteriota bacterium]
MRKNLLIVSALLLVLPCALVMAQGFDPAYRGGIAAPQSRNIPAGTVQDPGSHLTYIVDTGVNARAKFGAAIDAEEVTGNVLEDLDLAGPDGQLDLSKVYQNYISITNTHPTQAVTVHFRYFNDNCEDLLDFLVVLSCNDTLLFDPFNFEIPGIGENTRDRIFGPLRPGKVLEPITTDQFGSGRFVITAAASGADYVHKGGGRDPEAEILFPNEFSAMAGDDDCNMKADTAANSITAFESSGTTLEQTTTGAVANVGANPGLTASNLHVFNASQIAFNYLIGHLATAIPAVPGVDQVSWGVAAWARPVVADPDAITGDGAQVVPNYMLALGDEPYLGVDGQPDNVNPLRTGFFLRSEIHGGVQVYANVDGTDHAWAEYGALGTVMFHPVQDQVIHLLSVQDDYNGNNNSSPISTPDRSANISPAFSTYVLQIYDNDEHVLTIPQSTNLNVSPPRPGAKLDLAAVCFCLRTFLTTTIHPDTNVDDISIAELQEFFDVLSPKEDLDYIGLLATAAPDLSGGWIRFVRDNTDTGEPTDGVVTLTAAENAAIGGPFAGNVSGAGPGTAAVASTAFNDSTSRVSFMTIGLHRMVFEGFGASWYLHAVASDPAISELGIEVVPE